MLRRRIAGAVALAAALGMLMAGSAGAQTLAPAFAGSYTISDLGTPTGVPGLLGGLTFLDGSTNTLLIGGNANASTGEIYRINVTRGADGHINGFSGAATLFATAPFIDGGLAYGPNGVLFFTGFPNNSIGQIEPGSTTPDRLIDLTPLGVGSSVGALGFVPGYAPGAGSFKIVSYNTGQFYNATLTPDGSGTFNIGSVTQTAALTGGPEGFVYVAPGSPVFGATPTMLVSEYGAGRVSAFDVDAGGNPIFASRRDFITGLTGAEGAFIDPLTGDFLFSTFGGGNRVVVVRGFAAPPPAVPEPASLALLGTGLLGLVAAARRRRRAAR